MTDNASKSKGRKAFHEEFAAKVIEKLETGTAPWQKPWVEGQTLVAPHNPASGTVYKGMNRLHLSMSDFDDPRWLTFKQAQDRGLSVKSGSKGTPIAFYQFTATRVAEDENGKPILDEDGKEKTVEAKLERPIFNVRYVFNGEQIEGMPPLELGPENGFDWDPIEKAEAILEKSGATVYHDQSDRAFYRIREDAIHLPPKENFKDAAGYYDTALHELGHWTGHSSRLEREFGPFGSEPYAREELRAEIASWMISQDVGIPHDTENHASYVKNWVSALKEDPYEIMRACRDAENIKDYVLGIEQSKKQEVTREKPAPDNEQEAAMGVPANPASEKTVLAVPYREKEAAKRLGAKWDKEIKKWYAPEGTDLNPLAKWMPDKDNALEPLNILPPQEEFALALAKAGLDLRGQAPVMDGEIHRVPLIDGKNGELDGAYCGYLDDRPAGWMQNFSIDEKSKWVASGHQLNKEALEIQRADNAKKQEERQQAILERQRSAAQDAHAEWIGHDWASPENSYLQKKEIPPLGAREDLDGNLLIPVHNVERDLRGLQFISPDGQKRFLPGMEKKGNFHLINPDEKDLSQGEIIIAEGFSTAASIHLATEKPVVAALDAGNLELVAKALHEEFPNASIVICADNDHQHTRNGELWNKGVEKAEQAAQAVGGKVVVPELTKAEQEKGLTDFNDIQRSRGLKEVKAQLDKALKNERGQGRAQSRELSLGVEL